MTKDDSRIVKDPICGKDVDTLRARAVGIFGGVTYYFCSADCKSKYQDPRHTPRPVAVEPVAAPKPMIATDSPRQKAAKAEKAARGEKAKSDKSGPHEKVDRSGPNEKVEKPLFKSDKSGRFEKVEPSAPRMDSITESKSGRRVLDIVAEPESHDELAEELTPIPTQRRRVPLLALLLLALLLVGGVVLFTLKHK